MYNLYIQKINKWFYHRSKCSIYNSEGVLVLFLRVSSESFVTPIPPTKYISLAFIATGEIFAVPRCRMRSTKCNRHSVSASRASEFLRDAASRYPLSALPRIRTYTSSRMYIPRRVYQAVIETSRLAAAHFGPRRRRAARFCPIWDRTGKGSPRRASARSLISLPTTYRPFLSGRHTQVVLY